MAQLTTEEKPLIGEITEIGVSTNKKPE